MKDKICATLTKDHIYICSGGVIGRSGENECTQLEITLDECLCDKWIYIDFSKPDGTTGQPIKSTTWVRGENVIVCKPKTNYTLSYAFIDNTMIGTGSIFFYKDDDTYISYKLNNAKVFAFQTPDECYQLRIQIAYSDRRTISTEEVVKIQVAEESTFTTYEPYGYKIPFKSNEIITNIYLNEPLRKVGDYADYIDLKNKKVVRKVGVQIFDGTETWTKHTTTSEGYGVFRNENLLTPLIGAPISASYMTHFSLTYKGATADFVIGEYRFTYISGNLIGGSRLYVSAEQTTVDEFKEWVANNKPTIYYAIEETPEEIELPNIPTLKGTTILEVDTTIQPSNLEVVYKGK